MTEASTPEAHRLFIKSEQSKGKAVFAVRTRGGR